MSACLYMCVFICLSIPLCPSLPPSLPLSLSPNLPTYLPIYLSSFLSICPPLCLCIGLFIYLLVPCLCLDPYSGWVSLGWDALQCSPHHADWLNSPGHTQHSRSPGLFRCGVHHTSQRRDLCSSWWSAWRVRRGLKKGITKWSISTRLGWGA